MPARFAVTAALALAAGTAHAQVYADFDDKYDYTYEVEGLPDFDQVRASTFGIPGCTNDGKKYCGPTAVMNLLGFIGSHGWSHIPPGNDDWAAYTTGDGYWTQTERDKYNFMTDKIETLALHYMYMNPESGTDAEELRLGTTQWLAESAETWLDIFDICTWGLNGDDWTESGNEIPEPDEIAYIAARGAITVMRYGRYLWEREGDQVPTLLDRDGGHLVAIQAMRDNFPGFAQIVYRNSSTGEEESPFSQDKFRLSDRRAYPVYITNGGNAGYRRYAIMRKGESLSQFDPDEDKLSLIDDYLTIRPKYGFSLLPDNNMLDVRIPGFQEHAAYEYDIVAPPPGGRAIATRLSPTGLWNATLCEGDTGEGPGVWVTHMPSAETTRLADAASPRALCFGRMRELYTADVDPASGIAELKCYRIGPAAEGSMWVEHAAAQHTGSDIPALTYDDNTDTLLALAPSDHAVLRFPHRLEGQPVAEPLPSSLPLRGDIWMAHSHADNTLWISLASADLLVQLAYDQGSAQWIEIGAHTGHNVRGISLDSKGDVFASVNGAVRQLRPASTGGLFEPNTSMFVGQPCGDLFQVSQSRSSVNHDLYDLPGSHDLDADEIDTDPVCRADFNGDETVDTRDVLAYLTAWADGNLAADWNADADTNTLDFIAFLNAWNEGCE